MVELNDYLYSYQHKKEEDDINTFEFNLGNYQYKYDDDTKLHTYSNKYDTITDI